jgi:hypothetical protein
MPEKQNFASSPIDARPDMPSPDSTVHAKANSPRPTMGFEFVDSSELARRWDVPTSWIRDQVRKRTEDPLPHVCLGKYVRFLWGSPELQAWIDRRIVVGNNRRVGRVS